MAYVLPFFISDWFAPPDCAYVAQFREIVHSFAGGRVLGRDNAPIGLAKITKPRWTSGGQAPDFLHGGRRAGADSSKAHVRYPTTRIAFEARAAWFAEHYEWAIIAWSTSFQAHTAAFVTHDVAAAQRFEHTWRQDSAAASWDRLTTDRSVATLLGVRRTDVPAESFRIALLSEWEHEGAAVWEACDCAQHTPYLYARETQMAYAPEPPVDWARLGFRVIDVPRIARSDNAVERSTFLQPQSREALFDFLRCPDEQGDANLIAATSVAWTLFQGDPATASHAHRRAWESRLEGLANLVESVEWAYTRCHGGGAGERYEMFAARDPLLTREVTQRIEAPRREGSVVSGLL